MFYVIQHDARRREFIAWTFLEGTTGYYPNTAATREEAVALAKGLIERHAARNPGETFNVVRLFATPRRLLSFRQRRAIALLTGKSWRRPRETFTTFRVVVGEAGALTFRDDAGTITTRRTFRTPAAVTKAAVAAAWRRSSPARFIAGPGVDLRYCREVGVPVSRAAAAAA